jgi:hypothetical protein
LTYIYICNIIFTGNTLLGGHYREEYYYCYKEGAGYHTQNGTGKAANQLR